MKAKMELQKVIQDQTWLAALAISTLEPEHWHQWVCYLLEALQDDADGPDYVDFLERVRGDITTRLESGQW